MNGTKLAIVAVSAVALIALALVLFTGQNPVGTNTGFSVLNNATPEKTQGSTGLQENLPVDDNAGFVSLVSFAGKLDCPASEVFYGKCYSDLTPFQKANAEKLLDQRKREQGAKKQGTRSSGGGGDGYSGGSGGTGSSPQSNSTIPIDSAPKNSQNTAPEINNFYPENDAEVERGKVAEFFVEATDNENDSLSIQWFVGEQKAGEGQLLKLDTNAYGVESVKVRAVISDGRATASKEWNVNVIEPRPKPDSKAKIHPSLLPQPGRLRRMSVSEEKARLLVTLNDSNKLDKISGLIKESGGKIESQFEVGKVIVAEMGGPGLLEIAKDDAVVSLWPDFSVSAMLEGSVPQVNAPTAWSLGFKGENVRIAVLDTGIDSQHPMLKGKVVLEKNFSSSATVLDKDGHGTHVAGIIAGTKENNGRYDGVAPKALLYNAKVLNDNGKGYFSDVIAAINWATDPDNNPFTSDGANVINMSLGATIDYNELDPMYSTIKDATSNGIAVVVSSGNCGKPSNECRDEDGREFNGVTTPGNSPDAITVGAVDKNNNHVDFSSGANIAGVGIKPDLAAPGVEIFSAAPNNTYAIQRGTSMAAPHVSGAIALLLNVNPTLTPQQVKKLLEINAVDLGVPGKDINYGSGLLNLQRIFDARPVLSEENIAGTIDQSQIFIKTLTITNAGTQRLVLNGMTATPGIQVSLGKAALEPAESTDLNITISGATIGLGNYTGAIQLNTNAGTKIITVGIQTNSTTKPVIKSVNVPSMVFRGQVSDTIVEATDDSGVASVKIRITDQLGVYKEENLVLAGDGTWRKRDFGYSSDSRMAGRYRFDVTATDDAGNTTTYTTYYDLVNAQFSMLGEFITGQKSVVAFTFKNTGTLSTEATAVAEIYDEQETKAAELSQTMDVQSNETKDISLEWVPEKHGNYSLRAKFYQKQELLEDRQEKITVLVPDSISIKEFFAPQGKAEKGKTTLFKVLAENIAESDVNAFIEVNIMANKEIIDTALLDKISAKAHDTTTFTIEKQMAMPAGFYFAVARLHYGNRIEDSNSIEIEAITPPVGSIESIAVPNNVIVDENLPISVVFRNNGSFPLDVEIRGIIVDDLNKTIGIIDFNSARLAPNTGKTFEATYEFRKMSGNYTITITANYEGNTAETEKTIFVADNKQPVMTGLDFEKEIRKNNPFTATITVEDDSEITSAELAVDDAMAPMNKVALFADTSIFTGTFYDTTELKQHSFSVKVCDKFQNCTSTTSQAFTVNNCTGPRVLTVSDNDYFTSTLGGNYCASHWRKRISGAPTQEYLGRFDAVVWSEGDDTRNINDNEAALLNDYLASGGKLLLEGSSIAFRHRGDNFMQSVAHATLEEGLFFFATSQNNNPSSNGINAVRPHPVTKGLGYMDVNTSLATFSDSVAPANGGVSLADWNSAQSAIILYNNKQNNAKTLFLPFNFSALAQDKQTVLLANTIKWLTTTTNTDFTVESITTPDFIISNQNTAITVTTSNDPADINLFTDAMQLETTKTSTNTFTANTRFTPGKHAIKAIANPDYLAVENDYLNNGLEKEVTIASEEADMAITSILTKPQQPLPRETLQIDVNITNLGGKNGDANILLSVDGNATDFNYASIQPNSTISLSFNWIAEAGMHNIGVKVIPFGLDYNNSNDEMQIKSYSCTGKKVLVVSDDDAQYTTTYSGSSVTFEDALNAGGYCSVVWKESEKGTPAIEYVNSFDAIVWSSGNYWSGILDEKDKELLSAYPGNILFEGSDLGFDSNDNTFFGSITKANFDKDIILGADNSMLVLKAHKLLEGINQIDLNAELSPFPDSVEPMAGDMVAGWGNANAAITASEANGKKRAFIAFSVDAITDAVAKERLVSNMLEWLTTNNSQTSCRIPTGGMIINSSTTFCAGKYSLSGNVSVVSASDITLDCNGATLYGDGSGASGIYLNDVNNSTIKNCAITNYSDGVYAFNSHETTLRNNKMFGNMGGIEVKNSERISITDNNIFSNLGTGIGLENSHDSNVLDNNVSGNLQGISVYGASFTIVKNNVASDNNYSGILVEDSNKFTIGENTANNNGGIGSIYVGDSNLGHLVLNEASNNDSPGIRIEDSNDLLLNLNTANSNATTGILVVNSTNIYIDNATANHNPLSGIYIEESEYGTITKSVTNENGRYGILFESSNNNRIIFSKAANQLIGIKLILSGNNLVKGNQLSKNEFGFSLDNSSSNSIQDNNAYYSLESGVSFTNISMRNSIYGNYFYSKGVWVGNEADNIFCINGIGNNYFDGATGPICKIDTPPKIEPVAPQIAYIGKEFELQLNISDEEADQLILSDDTSLFDVNNETGIIRFTPRKEDAGEHTITVYASDGNYTAAQSFRLTIISVNHAPSLELALDKNEYLADEEIVSVVANAIDPDNDTLSYSSDFDRLVFDGKDTFTWEPGKADVGAYKATITVTDGTAVVSRSVAFRVVNQEEAPARRYPITIRFVDAEDNLIPIYPGLNEVKYTATRCSQEICRPIGTQTILSNPYATTAEEGTYALQFTTEDYQDARLDLTVNAGASEFTVTLAKNGTGRLTINIYDENLRGMVDVNKVQIDGKLVFCPRNGSACSYEYGRVSHNPIVGTISDSSQFGSYDLVLSRTGYADTILLGTTVEEIKDSNYSIWIEESMKGIDWRHKTKPAAKATEPLLGIAFAPATTQLPGANPVAVSIIKPADNSVYTAPVTINLEAMANSANSIEKVEFYLVKFLNISDEAPDENFKLATLTEPPYVTGMSAARGIFTITAKAYTSHGETATSNPITITIKPANPP